MRHAPSTLHFSPAFGNTLSNGAIEWEELPSLSSRLPERLEIIGHRRIGTAVAAAGSRAADAMPVVPAGRPWDSTRPAELDTTVVSSPFREPVEGIAIREVNEPDIFRHFFGG